MEKRKFIQVLVPLRLDWVPYYLLPEGVSVAFGDRVLVTFSGRQYCAVVVGTDCPAPENAAKVRYIDSVLGLPPISDGELKLWAFISKYYLCSVGEVYKIACPSGIADEDFDSEAETLRARIREKLGQAAAAREGTKKKAALLESARLAEEKLALIEGSDVSWQPVRPELSLAQQDALSAVHDAFSAGKGVLLDGVTGSGKTELYITLANEELARGRNVLMLVPEIALSGQLEERLRACFGARLLTYHSGETARHRALVANAVRKRPYVVLGTRSAIFLPHKNLGLVVVDEEHEGAYKQDSTPRYNGRDCAAVLANIHGARFICGSATPSLESIYNCLSGKYSRVALKERYFGSEAAKVEVVDTTAEFKKNGMIGSLSRKLIAQMSRTLAGSGQILVLRARRAYATAMQCASCGEIIKCPKCNVPMSYHKDTGKLVCHYCGCRKEVPSCPVCGGELVGIGSGTQKIEEEIREQFPQARIARLDGDTPPAERQAVTEAFASGETDILIGTQMLTKGFDFPGLKLVVAIGADSLVSLMDFRADEKAVQVLSQLRGRTSRRQERGLLVIQTARSSHPVYELMAGSISAETFQNELLRQREEFLYPPYTRMIDIILQDSFQTRLETIAMLIERDLSGIGAISIMGPFPPAVDRIAGKHIRIIRLTFKKDGRLPDIKKRLAKVVQNFQNEHKWQGHIVIDVDPL